VLRNFHLTGIENDIELRKAIVEFLSPMEPIPPNATHNGPLSLASAESLGFDNYPNTNKFEKKAIVTILGTYKGCDNFTPETFVQLSRYYDSQKMKWFIFTITYQGVFGIFFSIHWSLCGVGRRSIRVPATHH
jgi:hypothetical protein